VFGLFLPILLAASPVELAAISGANIQRPLWSPDGSLLSFEANRHEEMGIETYVGAPVPDGFHRVNPVVSSGSALAMGFQRPKAATRVVHELSWAPAPSHAYLFSANTEQGDYDLFLSTTGATSPTRHAEGGGAWSPDGAHIVFTSARSGDGDLYLLNSAATDQPPRQLTHHEGAAEVYASWSPDGQQIVYVTHSEHGDNLWWLPSVNHQGIRLTRQEGSQTRPRFSPNGRDIAYYVRDSATGRVDLFVLTIGAPAAPTRMVTDVVPNAAGPVWSPGGRFLIYAKNDDMAYDPLCATPIGRPETVLPLSVDTVGHSDLSVIEGPEGTWNLVYVAQGRASGTHRNYKRLYQVTLTPPKY